MSRINGTDDCGTDSVAFICEILRRMHIVSSSIYFHSFAPALENAYKSHQSINDYMYPIGTICLAFQCG